MPSDTTILAFDTSAAHCAAALLSGNRIIASCAEEMSRGQAERLIPLLEELLESVGKTWRDLSALGVGVGPGNFTGIRIGVSAARGLALGLDIAAVGVSGCESRARMAPAGTSPAIPAPRGMVYLCTLADPSTSPRLMPLADAQALSEKNGLRLHTENSPQGLAEAIAFVAAERWQTTTSPPAPLYVRPADAAPSRDSAPVLLD